MFMVQDKVGAIVLIGFSLLFLGSWPALLTLLERRERLPQHTYLDYSISNLLAAVLIALTFGQLGDGQPNFFTQLRQAQDNWHSVLFAIGGGAALSIGNVCTQYGWAYVGLSLTEVIVSSMIVVVDLTTPGNKIGRRKEEGDRAAGTGNPKKTAPSATRAGAATLSGVWACEASASGADSGGVRRRQLEPVPAARGSATGAAPVARGGGVERR